ncbi:MAG: hypothetical protein JST00_16630 [Deltaproteobacteria bacterium]|nr:hypothetical protein [Deltaproteobacteria bacterium]
MRKSFDPEDNVAPVVELVPRAEDTAWWDALCEETRARELEEVPLPPVSAPPGAVDGW